MTISPGAQRQTRDLSFQRQKLRSVRRIYYLTSGLYWFANALPMPVIVLLEQDRGLDLFEVGMLTALYAASIVVLEVPTGGLADSWGRRTVSVLALLVMAVSMTGIALAGSFLHFAAALAVYGLGRALISGALEAWFVDEVLRLAPVEELQRSLAYANTVGLAALSAAGLLGGWLPDALGSGTGPDVPGGAVGAVISPLALPPLASAAAFVLTAVLVAFLVRDGRGETGPSAREAVGDALVQTFRNRTLRLLTILSVVTGAAIGTMETYWQPHFAAVLAGDTPTLLFGVIAAGNFLVAMAGNILSPAGTRLLGNRPARFAAVAQSVRGVSVLLFAALHKPVPAIGAFWLAYMAVGAAESPHQTLINCNTTGAHRSAMLSVQSLAVSLGALVGGAGMGYLANSAGVRVVWIVTATYLMVSLSLYLRVDTRETGSERVQYVPTQTDPGTTGS